MISAVENSAMSEAFFRKDTTIYMETSANMCTLTWGCGIVLNCFTCFILFNFFNNPWNKHCVQNKKEIKVSNLPVVTWLIHCVENSDPQIWISLILEPELYLNDYPVYHLVERVQTLECALVCATYQISVLG